MALPAVNAELEARTFFGGSPAPRKGIELRVLFEKQTVVLGSRELLGASSSNALMQSVDAHRDISAYLKQELLAKVLAPWPRLQ